MSENSVPSFEAYVEPAVPAPAKIAERARPIPTRPVSSGPAASSAAASRPAPKPPAPVLSLLDSHANPKAAASAASSSGKKQREPIVKGRRYKYPNTLACDVIINPQDDDEREKLEIMSLIERYAKAFPDKGIDPNAAWDMDCAEATAYIRTLEEKICAKDGNHSSIVGLVVAGGSNFVEKKFKRMRGLSEAMYGFCEENKDTIKLLEAKYAGGLGLSPEVSLLMSAAMVVFAVWQKNRPVE